MQNTYRVLVAKTWQKQHLGPMQRLEYNIKIELEETGWGWNYLAQDRDKSEAAVKMVLEIGVP